MIANLTQTCAANMWKFRIGIWRQCANEFETKLPITIFDSLSQPSIQGLPRACAKCADTFAARRSLVSLEKIPWNAELALDDQQFSNWILWLRKHTSFWPSPANMGEKNENFGRVWNLQLPILNYTHWKVCIRNQHVYIQFHLILFSLVVVCMCGSFSQHCSLIELQFGFVVCCFSVLVYAWHVWNA